VSEALTAVSPAWEASLATALERVPGVTIARRCADVAELLSVAEAGLGDLAVVSVDLRDLDLEVVKRLRARGVRVIGVHPAADEAAERRLLGLGVDATVRVDAEPDELGAALAGDRDDLEAAWDMSFGHAGGPVPHEESAGGARGLAAPGTRRLAHQLDPAYAGHRDESARRSHRPDSDHRAPVIAVWGPTGAPGRTTIATTLAAELADRGAQVLLVDADTYGGGVAQVMGVLDEAPGVAAACRAADVGNLDVHALGRLAPEVVSGLRVLTGLPRADRWPELRAAALERVLDVSRRLVEVVVVDCGFCLEDDEELSYDTLAPRRNEATLTALAASDTVVAVAGADPVGLQRFVRGIQDLGTVPSGRPVHVVNRVRRSAVGGRPESRIADSLRRFAGIEVDHFVPDDPTTVDAAVLAGRSLVEQAPGSTVRAAVSDLASALAPWTLAPVGRAARRARGSRRSRRVRG
jgi:MinD-like ATPase involved in chromosome partitioning or flagellar assembly